MGNSAALSGRREMRDVGAAALSVLAINGDAEMMIRLGVSIETLVPRDHGDEEYEALT